MSQRVLVTNREWAVRTRDRGARFIKPLTGEIADVEAGTLVLLRQFAFPADPEDVARQLSGDSGIAAELLQRIDELVDVGLLIAHDDVYSGPRPTGFFGTPLTSLADAIAAPERSVVFLGVPYEEGAAVKRGTAGAPSRLRSVSRAIAELPGDRGGVWDPVSRTSLLRGTRVVDIGNIGSRTPPSRSMMLEDLRSVVECIDSAGCFPVIVGGDHSLTSAVVAGLAPGHPRLGVLQFDAHSDRSGIETVDISSLHHGNVMDHVAAMPHVKFLGQFGVRQLTQEPDAAQENVRMWPGRSWRDDLVRVQGELPRDLSWHLTIDCDCLDPTFLPSTGTPLPNGLSPDDVTATVRELTQELDIVSIDLVESIPSADDVSELVLADVLLRLVDAVTSGL